MKSTKRGSNFFGNCLFLVVICLGGRGEFKKLSEADGVVGYQTNCISSDIS